MSKPTDRSSFFSVIDDVARVYVPRATLLTLALIGIFALMTSAYRGCPSVFHHYQELPR